MPGRAGLRAGDGATPRRRRERRRLSRTRLSPKSLDVLPGQRPRRGLGAVGYEDRDREDEGGCGEHGRGVRGRSPRRLRRMRAPRRASSTAPTRASRTAGRTKAGPRTGAIARSRASSRDSEDRAGSTGCGATRARRRPSRSRPARGTVVPASRGRASRPAYGTSPPRPPLPRRRPAHRSATPTCSAWRPSRSPSPSDTAGRSSGARGPPPATENVGDDRERDEHDRGRRTGVAFGNSDEPEIPKKLVAPGGRRAGQVAKRLGVGPALAEIGADEDEDDEEGESRREDRSRLVLRRLAQRTISGETAKTGASATIPAWWPVTASGTRTAMPASGAPLPRSCKRMAQASTPTVRRQ